jgi:hypothetical protein
MKRRSRLKKRIKNPFPFAKKTEEEYLSRYGIGVQEVI